MFEVTQEQWEKVTGTSIYQQKNKSKWESYLRGTGPNYPMYYVSWYDAMAFCKEITRKTGRTYTLPTEAQWEYAARGGNKPDRTKYSGSDFIDVVAWYESNSGDYTHPVGSKRANGLGIYDMSGNVSEWCYDWYDSYNADDTKNPMGPIGPSGGGCRALRGGSRDHDSSSCRVSSRSANVPETRICSYGFRVVCIP